ncbi:hypothetical protein [Paludibacterium denitrificans]|uniref:Transmembrane protein n=1 Tax=Paludibacterium denitrificans TaxID=2675226 RepID=A0A844GA46_9NEIS|nr:hypothetical protein [Paludibacterium denitrificans]MTD33253.1 hypothetical protein [Paludibacterium denitrificans]
MDRDNPDLSGDTPDHVTGPLRAPGYTQSSTESDKAFNAQSRLYQQRHDHREWLFMAALAAAGIMVIGFMTFVSSVICWIWLHPDKKFDWHILLLGSALIIPPTMIVWNLMKQVFRSDGKLENGKKDDGGSGVLWTDVCKEALTVVKTVFSKSND